MKPIHPKPHNFLFLSKFSGRKLKPYLKRQSYIYTWIGAKHQFFGY